MKNYYKQLYIFIFLILIFSPLNIFPKESEIPDAEIPKKSYVISEEVLTDTKLYLKQHLLPYRPSIKNITIEDGLPFNAISDVFIDSSGYLWISSYLEGAAYYNGSVWKQVKFPNPSEHNAIRFTINTPEGTLWFYANNGDIVQYDFDNIKIWNTKNGVPHSGIISTTSLMVKGNKSTIWFGTLKNDIIKYENNKWETVTLPKEFHRKAVTSIYAHKHKNNSLSLFSGSKEYGVAWLYNNKWTIFNETNSPIKRSDYIGGIIVTEEHGEETLWIGLKNSVCSYNFSTQIWKEYKDSEGIIGNSVSRFAVVRYANGKSQLWLGYYQGGLAYFEDGKWLNLNNTLGIPSDGKIRRIWVEAQGSNNPILWVATEMSGIIRIDTNSWSSLKGVVPNIESPITSIISKKIPSKKSDLWMSSLNGIYHESDGLWSRIHQGTGLPQNRIEQLIYDDNLTENNKLNTNHYINDIQKKNSSDKTFLGVSGNKLFSITNNNFNNIQISDVFPKLVSTFVLKEIPSKFFNQGSSEKHNLLLGGSGDALLRNKNGWKSLPINNEYKRIFDIDVSSNNQKDLLWLGTPEGILRFDGSLWKSYTTKDGLRSNQLTSIYGYNSTSFGSYLWAATSHGISWINADQPNDTFHSLPTALDEFLPTKSPTDIIQDKWGSIYIGTTRGIIQLIPDKFPLSAQTKFTTRKFTKEDGLPSEDINQNTFYIDENDNLWVGTTKGPAVLKLKKPKEAPLPYQAPLYIENILVNNIKTNSLEKNLKYNQNSISFEYALLYYSHSQDIKFKTQLIGLDPKPSEWTKNIIKEYTTLPFGNYTFRVWAIDPYLRIIGPEEISFSIAPPFWKTKFAYITYIITISLIMAYLFKYRIKVLEQKNTLLENKVKKRTEELNQQKEALNLSNMKLQDKNFELDEKNKLLDNSIFALNDKNIELDEKNKLLDSQNYALIQKNVELERSRSELMASYQRADLIFSALSDALPGTVLDNKYKIGEKLGSGGFGTVYAATHLSLKKDVAIKVFRPAAGNQNMESLERFQREATSLCRIHHHNAVQVLDSGVSESGVAYIVMERLYGKTLREDLKQNTIYSPKRCLEIIRPICKVLMHIHSIDMVHRDIKPDNIFLHQDENGETVKILDFGIVKLVKESENTSHLTKTGELVGTPNYMAPELFLEVPYDGKVDVYAIGILLYRMLSGREPFTSNQERSMVSLALKHINEKPPPIETIVPSINEKLAATVDKALSKSPELRYNAKELLFALESAVASTRSTNNIMLDNINSYQQKSDVNDIKDISDIKTINNSNSLSNNTDLEKTSLLKTVVQKLSNIKPIENQNDTNQVHDSLPIPNLSNSGKTEVLSDNEKTVQIISSKNDNKELDTDKHKNKQQIENDTQETAIINIKDVL